MIRRRALLVAASFAAVMPAAALAASPPPSGGLEANPCKGIKNCITVAGPWVAVPATGEAGFLLECPKRSGTIAGTDVLGSSQDMRVVWDGIPGTPVRPGTSTRFFAFFRAASAAGKPGLFQPYIGCIPSPNATPRATVSARITRPTKTLDRWQTLVNLKAGTRQTASRGCGKRERLIGSWHAVVFGSTSAPDPALADKVHVGLTVANGKVGASIQTDAGMPAGAQAEVQVGAVCSK